MVGSSSSGAGGAAASETAGGAASATRPAAPGLLDPRLSASPRNPQAVLDHPVPERLDRQLQAV